MDEAIEDLEHHVQLIRGQPACRAREQQPGKDLAALLGHLRAAADGLETLRDAAADDDLTVDEAIRANPDVVEQVNRSSAQSKDDLVALGWLTCVGVVDEG